MSLAGALLLVVATVRFDTALRYPWAWALVPCAGTAAIIAAGPGGAVNRLLSFPPVVFAGLVSYPLYLWHWPILSFMAILGIGQNSAAPRVAAVGVAVVLAVMTYFFIERPVRRRPTRAMALSLFAVVLAIGALGLFAEAKLLKPRLDGTALALRDEARADWRYPKGLKRLPGPPEVQYYVKGTGPDAVLFVGDSNIEQYWPRIERLVDQGDGSRRALFATYGGCAPVPGLVKSDGRCIGFAERALELAEASDVKAVVLGAGWDIYFSHGAYRHEGAGGTVALSAAMAGLGPGHGFARLCHRAARRARQGRMDRVADAVGHCARPHARSRSRLVGVALRAGPASRSR